MKDDRSNLQNVDYYYYIIYSCANDEVLNCKTGYSLDYPVDCKYSTTKYRPIQLWQQKPGCMPCEAAL